MCIINSLSERSGLVARVTVVAQSNYDAVQDKLTPLANSSASPHGDPGHGTHIDSKKYEYGDVPAWQPDRHRPYSYIVLTTKAVLEYRHGNHLATSDTAEESAILDDFGAMLRAGGTELIVAPEIQRHKFAKTFWNIAFTNSPLTAIFCPPPNTEEGQSCAAYLAPEIVALGQGRAMGFPEEEDGAPSRLAADAVSNTAALRHNPAIVHLPGVLHYRNANTIEVEAILGEVVRMARERNVPISTLYALLIVMQNQILRGFKKPMVG
ncbi:hypothetical protein PAXRUDRAFT_33503 [Paxillus rubicundulus Ve08.2h10]|uniref:Ketopantoate reductase C-terminal domain-containing protein n=1 Tax=Paxillus rubicundulus Ve08.2h10 TaxID=930991 RepID=A0A0D0DBE5_9AGAM|nr:hypothetical protein PAXRUDRAFT_33503 [Paxillus rubicundulus Ve08.2h10]